MTSTAIISAHAAEANIKKPAVSNGTRTPLTFGMIFSAAAIPIRPMGTFSRKIQCHEAYSTR